jgi:hypothetical protein
MPRIVDPDELGLEPGEPIVFHRTLDCQGFTIWELQDFMSWQLDQERWRTRKTIQSFRQYITGYWRYRWPNRLVRLRWFLRWWTPFDKETYL